MTDRRHPRFAGRVLRTPSAVVGLVLLGFLVGVAVLGDMLAPGAVYEIGFPQSSPPTGTHLLGTDPGGRDMLFLVTRGIRTTLTVVAVVMVVSLPLGTALGLAAGWAGGVVDALITRVAEIVQSVPRFFIALVVIALYGQGVDKLILILSLTSWTFLARTLRAETFALKARPFVAAAQVVGAGSARIVARHILPHVLPRALVVVMLMGSRLILIEAGLAFLGLGDRSDPSLGVLASESQPYLRDLWWLSVFPGLAIVAMVLGLNLLGDGLGRALEVEVGTGSAERRAGVDEPN